jgi:hypothetical protein
MDGRVNRAFVILTFLSLLTISYAGDRDVVSVRWIDHDTKDIAEPRERQFNYAHYVLDSNFIEQLTQNLDAPRWFRKIAGRPKQAANVNAVDEVPDSSWYTNRHHLRRMSLDDLERGTRLGPPPDWSNAIVSSAKIGGVTPGLRLKDARGHSFIVKFDNKDYPELQSGAEMVSTLILHAAGYNVPENHIAYLDPEQLRIEQGVEIDDPQTGLKRPLTQADLDSLFQRVARRPDGRYRVLASRILPGKPKGPFAHVGIRRDDPNDRVPHEHRRELRGLRVIASWLNHWDMKEENSLDMYVEEDNRRFLRHYLIDFGSTLGGGKQPMEYFHGRESALDAGSIFSELFSLGLYRSADEKQGILVSPAIGMFSNEDFDPEGWKPSFPVMSFENMTNTDAFWATRIILSFTGDELRRIIERAEYTRTEDAEYLLKTLLGRREIIAKEWLSKVNPIAGFRVEGDGKGFVLRFRDLMLDNDFAAGPSRYQYRMESQRRTTDVLETETPQVVLDPMIAGVRDHSAETPIEVTLRTKNNGLVSEPVHVHLLYKPAQATIHLVGITRG